MTIDVNPEWWKSLFDDVYLLTDARTICDDDVTRREVDLFCRLLPLDRGDRILDLCGGQGRHSLELSRRGFEKCTVLDFSSYLVDHGRTCADREGVPLTFIRGDARSSGLPDESFDHVLIAGNSLGYLPGKNDDAALIREAGRLIRPGGSILIDVTDGDEAEEFFSPNAWHEIGDDIIVCRQREKGEGLVRAREIVISRERGLIREQSYAIRIYRPSELSSLVEGAGFTGVAAHRAVDLVEKDGDHGLMNRRCVVTARREGN